MAMTGTKIRRAELKIGARETMRHARPRPAWVTLVFLLLTEGTQAIVNGISSASQIRAYVRAISSWEQTMTMEEIMALAQSVMDSGTQTLVTWLLGVMVSLFGLLMTFGYLTWSMRLSRGAETGFRDLIVGFGYVGRVLGTNILVNLFHLVGMLVAYASAFGLSVALILAFAAAGLLERFAVVLALVVSLLILAIMLAVSLFLLRYAMALPALADDPERRTFGSLEYSKRLMKGRVWELFKLRLSFLGWWLLAGLMFLVGMFLVVLVLGVLIGLAILDPGEGGIYLISFLAVAAMSVVTIVPLTLFVLPYQYITQANYFYALAEQEEAARMAGQEDLPPRDWAPPPCGDIPPRDPAGTAPPEALPQVPWGAETPREPSPEEGALPEEPAWGDPPAEEPGGEDPRPVPNPWGDDRTEPF